MKRISRKLSSLSFTGWTVVALILWCTLGIVIAGSEGFRDQFHRMNDIILRDWLTRPQEGASLLKLWFVGMCAGMIVLGVNLVFCSWNKFLRLIRVNKGSRPRYIMLFVHILFGLVALGHFGSFMLGYRYENIRLGKGQSFAFDKGFSIKIERVHFIDDPRVLRMAHSDQSAADFHYRSNYADMVLNREAGEEYRGRAYILKPIRFKTMQVTLKRFTPARSRDGGTPGVVLVVSRNPVLNVFLILYPFMIVGIGIYLGMTWRNARGSVINVKNNL